MTLFLRLRRPTALLAASFAVVGFLLLGGVVLSASQDREEAWVRHTIQAQNALTDLIATLQDAESAARVYRLNGDRTYREAFETAALRVPRLEEDVTRLTRDNPVQQAALARLRPLLLQRLDNMAADVGANTAGPASDGMASAQSEAAMYALRQEIRAMRREESRLLATRQKAAGATRRAVQASLVAGFVALVALMVASMRLAANQLAQTRASRDALAQANEKLIAEADGRERAELQVRQMQKMDAIGHLTGGIAHDFNNMLSVVIGSLELARRRLDKEPDRAASCIDNAMDGAQRAAGLTARLLAFSRQSPLAPTPLDPNKLVGGMSELLRRTIGENVRVETVLAGGLWRVNVDAQQLENAILNLAVNARDAMPDGGRLTIESSNAYLDDEYARNHPEVSAGQYVLISMSDDGIGMSPEVIERAFDPFYTTKGVGRGTGLGLSQVYGFVKQSGGHIKIYSEVGLGTSLKIYLPRWTAEAGAEPASAGIPAATLRARNHEIILLVEDDEKVRHVTVDALRELGYTVVQASSGEAALEQFRIQPRIDLLLTDIVMPGMTGRGLADRVHAEQPDLKVLYMTGYTRNAVVHNGVLDAGVAFLQKPFTVDQLASKVRQVLDGEGANRPVSV